MSIMTLTYVVLIAFVFLLILSSYMMIDAYQYKKKLSRVAHYIDAYKAQSYNYFINADATQKIEPQNIEQKQAVEHMIENYIAFVKDDVILNRIYRYAEEQFEADYQKLLKSRSTPKRINVLTHIFNFKMTSLLPDVKQLLTTRSLTRHERVEGLKIIASLDETAAYGFYEMYRHELHDGEIDTIVSCMSNDFIYQIINEGHEDDAWLFAALKSMERRQLVEGKQSINRLLEHPNRTIQLQAIKILTIIGTMKPLSDFESLFSSEVPEERKLFAQLASHYPIKETYSYLFKLVQDRSFEVRTQAVKSLTYYVNHQEIFRYMLRVLKDNYAKDTIEAYMTGELVSDAVH